MHEFNFTVCYTFIISFNIYFIFIQPLSLIIFILYFHSSSTTYIYIIFYFKIIYNFYICLYIYIFNYVYINYFNLQINKTYLYHSKI